MFNEKSNEKLFFTEHWPASISTIKSDFSKSLNSLCNKSNIRSRTHSLSNSLSSSLSYNSFSEIYNPNIVIEDITNSNLFSSQGSQLDTIDEE